MRPMVFALAGLALLTASCDNSCQQICDRMADYAADCGVEVSRDDIKACKDAQAGATSRDDRAACREFNGRNVIEEEWECSEVLAYFPSSAPAPENDEGE